MNRLTANAKNGLTFPKVLEFSRFSSRVVGPAGQRQVSDFKSMRCLTFAIDQRNSLRSLLSWSNLLRPARQASSEALTTDRGGSNGIFS